MEHSSALKSACRLPKLVFDSPHLTDDFLTNLPNGSKSAVNSPMSSTSDKMKLLNDIGFANYGSESPLLMSSNSPKICLADFMGGHEKFLRSAGYWEAYQKNQHKEEIDRIRAKSSMSKPGKPYMMDINLERRVLFEEQKRNSVALIPVKLPSDDMLLPSYPDRIAHVNKLLSDNQKSPGSIEIKILPPIKNRILKKKITSLPGLSKHVKKALEFKVRSHNILDLQKYS